MIRTAAAEPPCRALTPRPHSARRRRAGDRHRRVAEIACEAALRSSGEDHAHGAVLAQAVGLGGCAPDPAPSVGREPARDHLAQHAAAAGAATAFAVDDAYLLDAGGGALGEETL